MAFIPFLHTILKPFVAKPVIDSGFLTRTFLLPLYAFKPEPLERLTFLLATALVPVVLLAVLRPLNNLLRPLPGNQLRLAWVGALAVSTSSVVWLAFHIRRDAFVLKEFFPPTPEPLLRIVLALAAATCVFAFAHRISRVWAASALALTGIALSVAVSLFTVSTISSGPRKYLEGADLDAVLYSVAQVTGGRGMLVNAANQYGLYPQFLEPLFRITGLTVLSFTVVTWLLISAGFLFIALLLWTNLRQKSIAPVALISAAHYGYFSSRTWLSDDPYPQYHPIRFLFPCLGLYLFSRYIAGPSRTLYYSSLLTASLSCFWNPDSGVAVLGSWLTLLAYREFSSVAALSALRATAIHGARALIMLFSTAAAYSSYSLIRYHALPEWKQLNMNLPVFYQYGGMMLPLPADHPWMLVIALFVFTLAVAAYLLLRRAACPRRQLQLVTAILGIGLFIYYQGRSHDNNLTMVIWPAVVLLALYADELLSGLRQPQPRSMRAIMSVLSFALLFFLCFPLAMVPDVVRATASPIADKYHRLGESGPLPRNLEMLQRYVKRGQSAAILSFRAGVYHAETGTVSAFTGPGLNEMLWRYQRDDLEKQIAALPDIPVFIDFEDVVNEMPGFSFPKWAIALSRGWTLLEQNVPAGGSLGAFRRTPKAPASSSWKLSENPAGRTLVHVRSSLGGFLTGEHGTFEGFVRSVDPPIVGRDLTVEILVKPERRQVPWATLVSTHPGSKDHRGFVLHHVPNRENYYYADIGNGRQWIDGPAFKIEPDVTSYVCMTIQEEKVRIFVNGDSVAEFRVPGGLVNSDFPVSAGEWQFLGRAFRGGDLELLVSEGALAPEAQAARWKARSDMLSR